MKTSRSSLFLLSVLLLLSACGGSPEEAAPAALGECCQTAMGLVEQMPSCCQEGTAVAGAFSGCCEKGMQSGTADADRPECCTRSLALMEGFKACCRETLMTGEAAGCCAAMPDALLANKPE